MLADKDLVSIQEVRTKVEKAFAAWQKYRTFSQEQVDAIVERMAAAARANAKHLADMAVEETGYGNAKDKYIKNLLTSDWLPRRMRGMKTVGIIREIPEEKIVEIGTPVGVVAAILPTTNPTSTAIYKILISLKAGNAVVISPHPRAHKCTCATAAILYKAAIEAGAPEDIIQCVDNATIEGTNALMRHERTSVILSTGGSGIVKAAYSSGKPAFGVGPGNVPVLVDTSADLEDAIPKIVAGKSFDYGTVCSSEQAIVAEASLRDRILALLKAQKAYLATDAQRDALGKLLIMPNWTVNPQCVGQAPTKIAKMAGFEVPPDTSILCAELTGVGKQHPLSAEKLSPVLSLYFVPDFNTAADTCYALLKFGGMGHTAVIYSKNDARTREYALRMPAMRILVNTPAPQGSTGITTNVFPSMTLGCGAAAGNITSDNIGPQHLLNIKRLAYVVRKPEEAFEMPLDYNAASYATPDNSASALPIDRGVVVAAVERYLASRGAPVQGGPSCACETSHAAPARSVAPNASADVVDRFLARRTNATPGWLTTECPIPPAPPSAPPPPPVKVVCEDDVRDAIREKRKIYIGPKTIVTPSARDLAGTSDILVLAKAWGTDKVDLNLNTLKREILEYLESSGLTVFFGHAGALEEPTMVLWDVEHQPDYRKFLETARSVGAQLIVFASREFDASDLDDLAPHLDEMGLSRDERREYDSRLRDLRIYQGVTCSLELAFDHNSRLYVFELQPDWYEDFLNIEDEIMSRFANEEDVEPDEPLGGYFSKN